MTSAIPSPVVVMRGTSTSTDRINTPPSSVKASSARPVRRRDCTIVSTLIDTPTNTSPASAAAAPALARKNDSHWAGSYAVIGGATYCPATCSHRDAYLTVEYKGEVRLKGWYASRG